MMPPSDLHPNPSGWVSRLQRYSIKDGPGIRTMAFLNGCSLSCPWCSNPELIAPSPPLLVRRSRCIRCGACIHACPSEALSWNGDEVVLDRVRCTRCGNCVEACLQDVYQLAGSNIDAESLAAELLNDLVFFNESCGGVTFSGGEAALQSEFVAATSARLHRSGVHVALDTAGHVPWAQYETLLPQVDLFLYDLKFASSTAHQQWLGCDNRLILDNLRRLASAGAAMWIRMVIVPGVNDSERELRARLELAASTPGVERVDLLPYHAYGSGKYTLLDQTYTLAPLEPPTGERMAAILELARSYLPASIGG